MSKKSKKKEVRVVSYTKDSQVRAAVVKLLGSTGRNRNGSASDYNFVRSVAEFGNEAGFVTRSQMMVLGKIYNRVVGRRASWKSL